MDFQIEANRVIEKLSKRISQDAQTIATLQVYIEMLQEELSELRDNEHGVLTLE